MKLDLDKYGWMSVVAWDPETFAVAMEGGRDGWAAYHRNDFLGAVKAFPMDESVGRSRAGWRLKAFYATANASELLRSSAPHPPPPPPRPRS